MLLISKDVYHTTMSYIIIDFSMTMYLCRLIVNDMFYLKLLIMFVALYLLINFTSIWRKWNLYLNLKFNWIFNIFKSILTFIWCSFNVMSAFMLYFFKTFIKWINSCFRSLNLKLCCFVHSTTLFHVFFKISQLRFINLLYVKMLMSLINSVKLKCILTLSHALNKFAL